DGSYDPECVVGLSATSERTHTLALRGRGGFQGYAAGLVRAESVAEAVGSFLQNRSGKADRLAAGGWSQAAFEQSSRGRERQRHDVGAVVGDLVGRPENEAVDVFVR